LVEILPKQIQETAVMEEMPAELRVGPAAVTGVEVEAMEIWLAAVQEQVMVLRA
jgi:hypothetical protein